MLLKPLCLWLLAAPATGSKCQRHSGKGGPNSNFRIQNDGAFSPGVIQMQFWSRGNGHTDITEKPCLPFLPWLCHLGLQEQKCPLVLGFSQFPQAGDQPKAGLEKGLHPGGSKPQAGPETAESGWLGLSAWLSSAPLPGWELYLNSVGSKSKALETEHIKWDI